MLRFLSRLVADHRRLCANWKIPVSGPQSGWSERLGICICLTSVLLRPHRLYPYTHTLTLGQVPLHNDEFVCGSLFLPASLQTLSWKARSPGLMVLGPVAGEGDIKMHCCVAAYISDYAFLGTALLPHQFKYKVNFMVSLDHSMWFHAPFRADHWMLYECESPWAGECGPVGQCLWGGIYRCCCLFLLSGDAVQGPCIAAPLSIHVVFRDILHARND